MLQKTVQEHGSAHIIRAIRTHLAILRYVNPLRMFQQVHQLNKLVHKSVENVSIGAPIKQIINLVIRYRANNWPTLRHAAWPRAYQSRHASKLQVADLDHWEKGRERWIQLGEGPCWMGYTHHIWREFSYVGHKGLQRHHGSRVRRLLCRGRYCFTFMKCFSSEFLHNH